MAITATGIGSGLDIQGLVSQIMQVERQPLTRLQQKRTQYENQISAFGQIKSALSELQSALEALQNPDTFSAAKVSVAANADFTATAQPGAAAGIYELSVQQLARQQRVATSATTQFDPSGGGTLDITVGGNTVSLTIAAGTTLQQLRDQINEANAGVTATIINNGSVDQLVISSSETGTANAFTLTGTGALAGLSFNDPNALSTNSSDTLYRVQSAQDAQLTVNGIAITRGSNTLTDVIDNVTLTLTGESNTTQSLTVDRDLDPAKTAIQNLADAYNTVMDQIDTLSGYDETNKTFGDLYGDSSLRGLRNQLRQVLGQEVTGLGNFSRLLDFGVEFDVTGRMTIDDSKLTNALNSDWASVANFFAGSGATEGLAAKGISLVDTYTESSGLIDLRIKGLQQSVKLLDNQQLLLEDRLARIEAMYLRQFNAMDALVGQMNVTGTYLAQQLAQLSGSSSG
ncbi:MAG: flagellar filament capping protein FliD [Hydrogenophilus thermoluteolus]